MGFLFEDDFNHENPQITLQQSYARQSLANRPIIANNPQPQQFGQQQAIIGGQLPLSQLSTVKIEINPFEIFSCNRQPNLDDCSIFTFRLARQNVVLLTDENQASQLTSLVPIFYSELNNASLDSLSLSDITLKYGGNTYTSHEFCPPYEITKTGKKIKIPLVLKNDPNQCSSAVTLLIWGCFKNNKNSNLKTLFVNGIIIDDTKDFKEESTQEADLWNDAKLISSSDNQISSKSNSSSQSHDW